MSKRVTFKPVYTLKKWTKDEKIEKSFRETLDAKEENIEEAVVREHEHNYTVEKNNKREICSRRMAQRDLMIQGLINPYLGKNNYIEDLNNQENFLRPQDSNVKTNTKLNKQ